VLHRQCLAAAAVLACAQPAAADKPQKVAIGPHSAKGALLFEVPPTPFPFLLLFTRTDGSGRLLESKWVGIEGKPADGGNRYIVETLPPGRYQLDSVHQQGKWVGCLEASTFKFSIEGGKIAYLGTFDARPTLASIQRNAHRKKELSAIRFEWHVYRTDIVTPTISGRDPESAARAASFGRQNMPKSSATATLADLQWGPYERSKPSGRPDRCN
jgi:hypothetical protein